MLWHYCIYLIKRVFYNLATNMRPFLLSFSQFVWKARFPLSPNGSAFHLKPLTQPFPLNAPHLLPVFAFFLPVPSLWKAQILVLSTEFITSLFARRQWCDILENEVYAVCAQWIIVLTLRAKASVTATRMEPYFRAIPLGLQWLAERPFRLSSFFIRALPI